MTQTQISCFLAAAEGLSFSKAAEKLMVSQPSISKMISQMESEVGFPLFYRSRQGISLTPAGHIMHKFFINALDGYAHAAREAARVSAGQRTQVRIGCLEGWDISNFYPRVQEHFARKYPSIDIEVGGYDFSTMIPALKQNEVDVALTLSHNLADFPEISRRDLVTTPGILLYSASNPPVRSKPQLRLEDFRDVPFFRVNEPWGYRNGSKVLRENCLKHGFDPVIVNMPTLSKTLLNIQLGKGVLLTDSWLSGTASYLFHYLQLDDVFYTISLGWLEDGSPEKRMIVDELCALFQSGNPD